MRRHPRLCAFSLAAAAVLLMAAAAGKINWTQINPLFRHGTASYGQASDGTGATGDCPKYTADGSLTDSGAACGGGGGGGGALTQIAQQAPSATNVVTFNTISGSYTDLIITVYGRSTAAATFDRPQLTLNNDTAAHYNIEGTQSNNAALAGYGTAGANNISSGTAIAGSTAPAGAAGFAEYTIYRYAGTSFNKTMKVESGFTLGAGVANFFSSVAYGEWTSTAAVTRVDVTLSSNFASGSLVTLYGRL